jgi:hypothetical protein
MHPLIKAHLDLIRLREIELWSHGYWPDWKRKYDDACQHLLELERCL